MDSSTNSERIKRHLTIQPREEEVHTQPLSIATKEQLPMTSFHLGEEVIGGFAAGVIGTLLGFPLDLVKTRYVCVHLYLYYYHSSCYDMLYARNLFGLDVMNAHYNHLIHLLFFIRMQTQSSARKRSPISILSHILRTEGLRSIYKGVGPPLVSLSIVNTLSFTSYSYFRSTHFHGKDCWDYKNALSGMVGKSALVLFCCMNSFVQ